MTATTQAARPALPADPRVDSDQSEQPRWREPAPTDNAGSSRTPLRAPTVPESAAARSRLMSGRSTILRSFHDVGLAVWCGGTLMGAVGLNGAAKHHSRSWKENAALASVGWRRWTPIAGAAIAAHLLGSSLLAANAARAARRRRLHAGQGGPHRRCSRYHRVRADTGDKDRAGLHRPAARRRGRRGSPLRHGQG